jgi:hypothetical protein
MIFEWLVRRMRMQEGHQVPERRPDHCNIKNVSIVVASISLSGWGKKKKILTLEPPQPMVLCCCTMLGSSQRPELHQKTAKSNSGGCAIPIDDVSVLWNAVDKLGGNAKAVPEDADAQRSNQLLNF